MVDAVVARVDVVDDTPYINDDVFVVSLLLVLDVVRVISITEGSLIDTMKIRSKARELNETGCLRICARGFGFGERDFLYVFQEAGRGLGSLNTRPGT